MAAFLVAVAFLASGVATSGIWDPHELDRAELARRIAIHLFDAQHLTIEDAANTMPTLTDLGSGELGFTSMAAGLGLFGLSDWAGRLPLALWAVLAAMVLFVFLARTVRPRAGLYAVLVLCTMPLFFVHARTMLGDSATMACATLCFCGFCGALLEPSSRAAIAAWLTCGVAGALGGFLSRGLLLGVGAPLLAVGLAWAVLAGNNKTSPRGTVIGLATLAGGAAAAVLGIAAMRSQAPAEVSRLVGFALVARPPVESTFDLVVRDLGHALFPWSAFLPFAFGRLFVVRDRDVGVRVALLVGASVFYAAYAFVAPRAGALPFAAPAVLAAIAALALDDVDRGAPASAVVGAGTAIVGVVLLRDFSTIPNKVLVPFGVGETLKSFVVEDRALLIAGAVSFLVLVFFGWVETQVDTVRGWIAARVAAYRSAADQLQRVWKGNLVFGFLLLEAGLVGLGAMLVVGRRLGWASVVEIPQQTARIGLNLWWFLPLALLAAPLVFDAGRLAIGALPRGTGMVLAAVVAGGLLSFGFYPALASQLSPRGAFQRYAELHRPGEPLATLGLRARVVRYYARGEDPRVLAGAQAAADWLEGGLERSERRWLIVRERELGTLNSLFRKAHGQNLPVLDASTGSILLASSTLAGSPSDNPLDAYVLPGVPERIQHPVSATFGDDLDALGWEIANEDGELMRYVVPGRTYTMRFFYRVRRSIARNYQAFLHVDGYGRRHNGDHEVLDGRYRMTLWQPGDVIADHYELDLEANFLPGDYHVYFGFFSGKPRYPVSSGQHDEDRVFGGVLSVR